MSTPSSTPAVSPFPAVTHEQQQSSPSKKRRRNFRPNKGGRPKQQQQSPKTNKVDVASSLLTKTTNKESDANQAALEDNREEASVSSVAAAIPEQHVGFAFAPSTPSTRQEASAEQSKANTNNKRTTTATTSPLQSKKRKKRKATGVISVGISRAANSTGDVASMRPKQPGGAPAAAAAITGETTRTKSTQTTEPAISQKRKGSSSSLGGASFPSAAGNASTGNAGSTTATAAETQLENKPAGTATLTEVSFTAAPIDDPDEAVLAQAENDNTPLLTSYCSRYESRRHRLGRNKASSDNKQNKALHQEPQSSRASKKTEEHVATRDTTESKTTTRGTASATTAAPMVQIVNGEIVLQESSMVVNGSVVKPDDEFSVVEEEAQLAVVGASYNSFVKRRRPQHWTVEDTKRFYEALRQVGTDFGTMEVVFFDSRRTRKQLKRKYQIESTRNPQLVERALEPSARKGIDLSLFELAEEKSKLEHADASGGRGSGSTNSTLVLQTGTKEENTPADDPDIALQIGSGYVEPGERTLPI